MQLQYRCSSFSSTCFANHWLLQEYLEILRAQSQMYLLVMLMGQRFESSTMRTSGHSMGISVDLRREYVPVKCLPNLLRINKSACPRKGVVSTLC